MENLTVFDKALKDFYHGDIVDYINNEHKMRDMFAKKGSGAVSADGRQVVTAAHVGRNQGVGSIGENKTLPLAGNEEIVNFSIPFRWTYGRVSFTGQVIKASKTSKGAFTDVMTFAMENVKNNIGRQINRALWGYGVGILARVNGSHGGSATTVALKSPGGFTGSENGARFILDNEYIAVIRNSTPTSAADSDIIGTAQQVTAKASDGSSVDLGATFGVALNDDDMIVKAPAATDANTETSVNREPMGIPGLVDDGTFISSIFGLSRTTYPILKSPTMNMGGASFSVIAAQRMLDLIADKGGLGSKKDCNWFAHSSLVQEYEKVLIQVKRFVNEHGMSPDLGFDQTSDIELCGFPIKKERMAPYRNMYFVNKAHSRRYVNCEGEWVDIGGGVLQPIANKDAVVGQFRIYDNFQHLRYDTCGRMYGFGGVSIDVIEAE